MNRTILTVSEVSSALSPLLVESAVKGTALLVLAAIATTILRRDSAATRHLVWLLAIVAMLVVPVLSAMLPQWRVLPEWAGISPKPVVVDFRPPSLSGPAQRAGDLTQIAPPVEVERPAFQPPAAHQGDGMHRPAGELADSRPAWLTPQIVPQSGWNWTNALSLVWAVGFSVLSLRLLAARWMLYRLRLESRPPSPTTVIGSKATGAKATHDAVVTALEAVCRQLGIVRPVTLLIHPDKTIPVVWGILRCHLLLPGAARLWSGEQLQSVLLHELAHIKRRDTMAQLLTQIACALYWFNPLVWFTAWRLGVERERACDDLVLASGVRPSAYAAHLLEVVTQLSPTRLTQLCGLAMARQSSLEGRLTAVLSGNRNRRGVTRMLVAAAVVVAVAVAIPLAIVRAIEPDQPKTETANVNTQRNDDEPKETSPKDAAPKVDAPKVALPKDDESRPFFENWKTSARTDGKIPGGRIGELAASLKTFMDLNPGHEQSVKLEPVLEKCDASRDWAPAEAAALLDEVSQITPRAAWAMRANSERQIHPGKPLPVELADAPWGEPEANGLRMAWLLEPRAQTQALDSVMRSRVLFHNTGEKPVCFATENWIQSGGHKAKGADGNEIGVWAIERMGLRLRMVFRLAPGEYAEVEGNGIGVGDHETASETNIYKVGCWIEAKLNDEVTFTPANVLVSFQTWQNNEGLKDSTTVWREMIAARVAQESPMPAAATDREQLLRRVTNDLLGNAPTAQEISAFTADDTPDALAKLTARLLTTAGEMHFAGELAGGTTQFRVTAAAPRKVEPNQGAKLQPGTEERLEWGEAVNGLRTALAWPPTLGEPAAGDVPDFFLAVQNVSAAPVRLCTKAEAPNQRRLTISTNGVLQARTVSSEPNGVDVTLKPREVVFLRLFVESAKDDAPRATHGSMMAAAVRQSPAMTLLADIEIAKAPEGAWTGKLVTPETRAGVGAQAPKNRKAQELFKVWLANARVNGKVPGGCIARLGDKVSQFVQANIVDKSGEPYAKKMEPLVPRLDGARDWQPAEASALLMDIAAVSDVPLSGMLEEMAGMTILFSPPLTKELEKAPWGKALPNGLRVACLFEPRAAAHRLGTALKMRILVHNAGNEPVVFRARTWHHIEPTARNAKGEEIEIESITRYTRPPLVVYRLMPGGFFELASPGVGIGKRGFHDFKNGDVASWIDAKVGDEVTLTPGPVPLGDWNEVADVNSQPRWWLDFLTARLNLATPLSADASERAELLRRTVSDVFYSDVTAEEIAAFVGDGEPDALASLAKRLAGRSNLKSFSGSLQSGTTKFRVTAEGPRAARRPEKPAAQAAPAEKEEKLRVLIERVLGAHGGEEKLSKLKFTEKVKQTQDGNLSTIEYFVQPPNRFRSELQRKGEANKQIYIGKKRWTKHPNGKVEPLEFLGAESPIEYYLDDVKFFGPRIVLRLKDTDHRLSLLDEVKIDERAAVGVEVSKAVPNSFTLSLRLFFDKETNLLVKQDNVLSTFSVAYSDYETFDGIPIARKMTQTVDGKVIIETEVTDFQEVDKLDAKLFEQP